MVNLYLSVALLLSQLTPLGLALRLLLIGDSVDRCIVQDWCGLQRNRGVQVTSFNWGDSSIKYASKKGMMPSDICVSSTDSIAFVHIFGSNATGPYLHMFSNSPEDPYVDTQVRVKKSIELYKAHVGLPDRIIFQTNQWDVQRCYDFYWVPEVHSELWNTTVESFERSLEARVDEILEMVGGNASSVDVGLRTAVWGGRGGNMLHEFNNIQRRFASRRNLTLYDFDRDVWSSVNYDYSREPHVLRDWIHPNTFYTAVAGEKMLEHQFSSLLELRTRSSLQPPDIADYFSVNATKTVCLVRTEFEGHTRTFYYNSANRTLHRNPSHGFLIALHLGPADVLGIKSDAIHLFNLVLGDDVPDIFDECSMLNSTTGAIYVIKSGVRREVPVASVSGVAFSCNVSLELDLSSETRKRFVVNVNELLKEYVKLIPTGVPILDIYAEGTLVKLQSQREIFYVKSGKRFSIPNMQTFWSLGKQLSDVIQITDAGALESIPLGSPAETPF